MEGLLYRKNGSWIVKWSDVHSFAEGDIWTYTELHPDEAIIIDQYTHYDEEDELVYEYDGQYIDIDFKDSFGISNIGFNIFYCRIENFGLTDMEIINNEFISIQNQMRALNKKRYNLYNRFIKHYPEAKDDLPTMKTVSMYHDLYKNDLDEI